MGGPKGKGQDAATGKDIAEVRLGQWQASVQGKDGQKGKTEDMSGKLMKPTFILI